MTSRVITPSGNHKFEGHEVEQIGSRPVGTDEGNLILVRVVSTGDQILVLGHHVLDDKGVLATGTKVYIRNYDHNRTLGTIKTQPYKDRNGRVFYGVEHAGGVDAFSANDLSTK